MSVSPTHPTPGALKAIVGEPEVVEDTAPDAAAVALAAGVERSASWLALREAVSALQGLQAPDGSVPDPGDHDVARAHATRIRAAIAELAPRFPHDASYLAACGEDLRRWAEGGFGVPDFLDAVVSFHPERHRIDGLRHLVVFPMHTQNGSRERLLEAVLVEAIWPEAIAALEAGDYGNRLFVSLRLVDFTAGYDTDSAVLFPETVAVREVPEFTWGAIFQDREAARYRRVVAAAAEVTKLAMPADAQRMLDDQHLAEQTFVMWDLIHDRTHMRGDLPFDPFMIKQRMPYFLYSLEELRCDLTAYRECVGIERRLSAQAERSGLEEETREKARLVQYAVVFDRIFRFALTGSRVRNYDGLGGQLLFAWLHQRGVLHWTDSALRVDWDDAPAAVVALGDAIDELYWRSIDRPKVAHWLAAHELIRGVLAPHPASAWAAGLPPAVLAGPPRGYTDAVLDDEFPLSMFYEALEHKLRPVIASTRGIRA